MPHHPHIKSARIEWVVEQGRRETELVIVTDLETRPEAPGFEEARFNAMLEAAVGQFSGRTHRRVRIMPMG